MPKHLSFMLPVLLLPLGCAHKPSAPGASGQPPEEHAIACTQIGCLDQLGIELESPSAAWAPGSYTLDLNIAGAPHACAFELPQDLPAHGNLGQVQCTPAASESGEPVQVMILQVVNCTEQVTEDVVSSTCEPVPERHTIQIGIPGTPGSVTLDLKRDGAPLLTRSYEPTYAETRPNGPQCEPVCRQARLEESL